ncbi:MAG: type II toxin-antitoxin system VapB family antitoxin [Planctomycetes bacterium]|nr:type II toxin-antitoxin system VapB family antitoxin [Planctomycetota bacterium]MBI3843714.1 type II toxin-antitoxin system VapB family antitoxin [Planctomycetota bacterium]
MKTTIELDKELVREALRATGAKNTADVVELGLRALLENVARKRLIALRGALPSLEGPPRRRAPRRRR